MNSKVPVSRGNAFSCVAVKIRQPLRTVLQWLSGDNCAREKLEGTGILYFTGFKNAIPGHRVIPSQKG